MANDDGNVFRGIEVDNVVYEYDFESIANMPDILRELPTFDNSDYLKYMTPDGVGGLIWADLPGGGEGEDSRIPDLDQASIDDCLMVVEGSAGDELELMWGRPHFDGVDLTNTALDPDNFSSSDDGKVLTYDNSMEGFRWEELPERIPSHSNFDQNKLLSVDSQNDLYWRNMEQIPDHESYHEGYYLTVNNQNNLTWHTPPDSLPSHTYDDEGKVLTLNNNNAVVWDSLPTVEAIPPHGSEEDGKFLTCGGSEGSDLVWADVLPSYGDYEVGKVLTVVEYGGSYELRWEDINSLIN